mmetsp:Transcript_34811/g.69391  ORF Transcript_34811/g.69391 Transcript_34811/m.69391 type:complete len:230 (-) Transcript_34811:751-1440(-)
MRRSDSHPSHHPSGARSTKCLCMQMYTCKRTLRVDAHAHTLSCMSTSFADHIGSLKLGKAGGMTPSMPSFVSTLGEGNEDTTNDGGEDGGAQYKVVAPALYLMEDENAPERRDDARAGSDDREGDGDAAKRLGGEEPTRLRDGPHEARDKRGQREARIDQGVALHHTAVDHEPESRGGKDAAKVGEDVIYRALRAVLRVEDHVGRRERVAEHDARGNSHQDTDDLLGSR